MGGTVRSPSRRPEQTEDEHLLRPLPWWLVCVLVFDSWRTQESWSSCSVGD